jgi:colanic acid biosynthesis glycosyl transferase WcaI
MNIIILGLNYAPEPVGIGPYTHGMASALAANDHHVTVVCGKPYYPAWRTDPAFAGGGIRREIEDNVEVIRVPIYVPSNPNGWRRLIHHVTFALSAQFALVSAAMRQRPDIVIGIAPSLISLVAARIVAKMFGAKLWIHIQDFEVEAAFATGLLRPKGLLTRLALAFETWSFRADRISTISPQMCSKLIERGIDGSHVIEFRNWANISQIQPLKRLSIFADRWGINQPYIALYSGNIANKQGIEIIVDAARRLVNRTDLMFVICGNGPNRSRLMSYAEGLDNVRFFDLQPPELLSELLGLATVHLLPQIAEAADLVLPSKLTNILASGRPVIATALRGTGLAYEIEGCGIATPPGDDVKFAAAIQWLIDNREERERLGAAARVQAEERWSQKNILSSFEKRLAEII